MKEEIQNDSPPVLGSWQNIYLFVLILHAVVIALFYAFTRYFA